jgi:adenine-specific DNA-methyltransferase
MEFKELKGLLQKPYTTNNWRSLLSHVFEYVQFLDVPIIIPTDDNRVNQLKQYGTVRLSDGKNLALFELTLNDNVNLIRNRVGLNELVKKYIDQDSYHGILSIFEQGKEDYRFTFTARNTEFDKDQGFIDKDTDTRRFTYILGANESCRTAAERFDALSKIDNKNIEAVEDAFNVEKLSKKFFKEYIEQFNGLVASLKSKPTYFQAIFEKDETATRNFVKRLMGRLVFLKFIQKKGWLGVPVSETGWNHGNYQFLEDQFKSFDNKGLFVSQFLNPMFYEALNVGNRPNDEFQNRGYKIPYLSGGLFDNDNPKENRINFEERELTNLFDFFERYNFTIDENDLHDKEVGIDPEMLGHIFENLLEDNKDKGAFYTPKEIVRYMCQESLKEYLKTYLDKQQLWPSDEVASQNLTNTLAAFVEKKETAAILRYDKELATALRDVKICDPAIGSGAFPMGLLNEIFTMIKNLHDESPDRVGDVWNMEGKKWQPNIVKQNIIQNSIYGVDIEAGAVDIARLRFWLSLVIEETEPKPLPHLDYKIVVGNSLVSKLEDTIIDIEWDLKPQMVQADIFGNEGKVTQKRELIREITDLQKQVFEPDSDEEIISIAIRNKKIDLLVLQLEIMIDENGVTDKPQGTGRNITVMTQKWLETKGWQQQISKLKSMKKGNQTPLVFFDWLLDFPEVTNPEVNPNPGFDIVIANPPYIGQSGNRELFREVLDTSFGEKFHQRRMDYFYFFFHKSITLSKSNAVISFITTNYFLNATYADKLRKDIYDNCEFLKLVNFNEAKIFENATGQHNVITILKNSKNSEYDVDTSITNYKGAINSKILTHILNGSDKNSNYFKFKSYQIFEKSKKHILVEGIDENNPKSKILNSIAISGKRLIDIVDVFQGIVTGANNLSQKYKKSYKINKDKGSGILVLEKEEKVILSLNEFELKFIKPWFKNSDIDRWSCNEKPSKFLIYLTSNDEVDIKKIPNLINHFQTYKQLLVNRNVRTGKYSLEQYDDFINDKIDIPYVMIKSTFKKGVYFCVSYARDKYIFESSKIVCPQRSPKNTFAFTDKPWYAASDVYYIVNKENQESINLKCLTGILNSKLIYFWLYNRGQRKGEILQLFKDPLSEIPIILPNENIQKRVSSLSEVLINSEINLDKVTIINKEQEIDNLVYKLYNLTYEEALIVEPELSTRLTKIAYEALEVN